MPVIYDNIQNYLNNGLNATLAQSKRTDLCVGYFNLRGWKQLADNIDQLSGDSVIENEREQHRVCRLLVGMQKMPLELIKEGYGIRHREEIDSAEAVKLKKQMAQEFKDQLTYGIQTNEDELGLRKLCLQLKSGKVLVKLHLRHTLHAKLYLCYLNDRNKVEGFIGSSNLTLSGLAKQGELNIDVLDQDAAHKLVTWFEDRWKDKWCIDITAELIEIIDNSWAAESLVNPYHIYLKIAYHLSTEARSGLNEYNIPKVFLTGDTQLLPFQSEAVRIAAKKLKIRGGVLIGDVVGLGKTITACAIAKLFEDDHHFNTLIICPKNLVEMWRHYVTKYQMRARVISISKLTTDLKELKQYTFSQVIIDESHNLRNSQGRRYKVLKEFLDENNGNIILLSATPYNKSYVDLSNQLRLTKIIIHFYF